MAKGRGRGGFSNGGSKCGRCCSGFMRRVRSDLLLVLIIIGVVIGFVIGALVNDPVNKIDDVEDKKTVLMLIGFAGELFMNMLKMLILPLIVGESYLRFSFSGCKSHWACWEKGAYVLYLDYYPGCHSWNRLGSKHSTRRHRCGERKERRRANSNAGCFLRSHQVCAKNKY